MVYCSGLKLIDIYSVVNRLLGANGSVIRIRFNVGERFFEAYVPDDELWGAVKDVLINREYEYYKQLFGIRALQGFTVIDVGANVGLYSLAVSTYADKVISIEAHPVIYKLLEINKIINNVDTITTLNAAVIGSTGEVELCEGSHSGGASIMIKSTKCYKVHALQLDELIKQHAGGGRVILKMDIEGAEFSAFQTLKPETLRLVDRIVMEVHLDHGSIETIVDRLKVAGFTIKYLHPPVISKNSEPIIKLHETVRLKILRRLYIQ